MKKRQALVSIIITTKNEEKVLGSLIKSIKKQSYKNKEIILVDNSSTDGTLKIAKRMGIHTYNFGPERSAQRNYGAKKALGKYFLFLDADMKLSKNVVSQCAKLAEANLNIGGIAIPEKSRAVHFWEKVKAFERSFYNEISDPLTDAARFFPKRAFLESGGYDETITGPEDWDLSDNIRSLGYNIGSIKDVIYHMERVRSPYDLAKKKFYYALRTYRYLAKYKLPIVGPKTVYFLRPIFYKNSNKIIAHPILSLGMIILLFFQFIGGGLGYFVGRFKKL